MLKLLFFSHLWLALPTPVPLVNHTLTISNLDNKKGKLYIAWYKSESDYDKKINAVFQKIEQTRSANEQDIVFENIPTGIYAIAIFLDENDNGKLDTNFLGIPKEKYGFSNNKFPLTRAASFREAAVAVGESSQKLSIRLK